MKILWWFLGRLLTIAIVLPILAALAFVAVSRQGSTFVADVAARYLAEHPESDVFGVRRLLPTIPAEPTTSSSAAAPRAPATAARVVESQVWRYTAITAGRTTVTFTNQSPTEAWTDCTVTLAGGYRAGPFALPAMGRHEFALTSFRTTGGQPLPASMGTALTAAALTMRCVGTDRRPVTIAVR